MVNSICSKIFHKNLIHFPIHNIENRINEMEKLMNASKYNQILSAFQKSQKNGKQKEKIMRKLTKFVKKIRKKKVKEKNFNVATVCARALLTLSD